MLFLLRPRQTYMPYALPRDPETTETRNEQLHKAYSSTRRVAAPAPSQHQGAGAIVPRDVVADLKDLGALHESGALTDQEFAAAKARVLSGAGDG
jgi:Short C-terminal domain